MHSILIFSAYFHKVKKPKTQKSQPVKKTHKKDKNASKTKKSQIYLLEDSIIRLFKYKEINKQKYI